MFVQDEVHNTEPKQSLGIISIMNARKALRKGCKAFLAHVVDVEKEKIKLDDIPIVKKFFDIFSDELPGLPQSVRLNLKLISPQEPDLYQNLLIGWLP